MTIRPTPAFSIISLPRNITLDKQKKVIGNFRRLWFPRQKRTAASNFKALCSADGTIRI